MSWICRICGDMLKLGPVGLVHVSSGTMYVCKHRKIPGRCPEGCQMDDHCAQPLALRDGLHDCSDIPNCDCGK